MSTLQTPTLTANDSRCGRAALVVYRLRKGRVEFLLVSRSSDPDQFVLPAGRVEPGESLKAAATRECLEEAGVKARVETRLTQFDHFNRRGDIKPTRVFLANPTSQKPSPEGRHVIWARHKDLEADHYDVPEPTRQVLDLAAQQLNELTNAA